MYTEEQKLALKNIIGLLTSAITNGVSDDFAEGAGEVYHDLIKANIPYEVITHFDQAIKHILKK